MDTYRATNTLNGKFYIGSSVNFEKRKAQHLGSKKNYPFQTDLRQNPEAFEWEVQSDNCDEPVLEQALLDMWFGKEYCYNLNPIAERPPDQTGKNWWKNEFTQEQTVRVEKPEGESWEKGVLQKSKDKQFGENNPMYGRTGENNHLYGRTGSLHHRSKAVIAIEPDGTEWHFGSSREAARDLKINNGNLCCRYLKTGNVLKQGKFKGWRFVYENL